MRENSGQADQRAEPIRDGNCLCREARRRMLARLAKSAAVALLAGAVLTAGLSLVPRGQRERLIAAKTSGSGQMLVCLVQRQYGWPRMLLHESYLVRDSLTRQSLAIDPRSVQPGLPPLEGWKPRIWLYLWYGAVAVPEALVVYLLVSAVAFTLPACRSIAGYRAQLRSIAAHFCPVCGYPKFGLPGPRCPECGQTPSNQRPFTCGSGESA